MQLSSDWKVGKRPGSPMFIYPLSLPKSLPSPQNPKALWNILLKPQPWGIKGRTLGWKFLRQTAAP